MSGRWDVDALLVLAGRLDECAPVGPAPPART